MTKDISPPTPPLASPVQRKFCLNSNLEQTQLAQLIQSFQVLSSSQKEHFLKDLVSSSDNAQLAFLNSLIAPKLKVDFLKALPPEIALQILSYIDSPKTLARANSVSKYWHALIQHDLLWRPLCESYRYLDGHGSYRNRFRRHYSIACAWHRGGRITEIEGGFSEGLVTCLQFDEKYTVIGCDNHRIEVYDTATGSKIRTLEGHEGGVWALQFKGDDTEGRTLLSGGCDRDVRVWDLNRGVLKFVLHGHTSTVRCLKMRDKHIAVTGSRDATLRVWDLKHGFSLHVLTGHRASVRCLDVHEDIVVSGSYDSQARIWDINTGRCKHVLAGHVSQIYAIVTNGKIVATGSLDAHIRVWSVETGECLATLHGHTSLVGQIQLSGMTLVSGGADGCLRVWDMETFECIQQFSAHDNSITCLQFDEDRILSAGNDGKVKIWDIKKGQLIRNLTQPSKTVWKIQFNKTKAVVLMQRLKLDQPDEEKTVMEIHDFDIHL